MKPAHTNGDTAKLKPEVFPDYRRSVGLKYVKRGYTVLCRHALTLLLVPLAATVVLQLISTYQSGDAVRLWQVAKQTDLTVNLITIVTCTAVLFAALLSFFLLKSPPVYLVDYAVYRPPDSWSVRRDVFMEGTRLLKNFDDQAIEFQEKILYRSGLGNETYLPPAVIARPPTISMESARQEFEQVAFGSIKDAFAKTGVGAKDIGILVVNCSLFNPTPSLSAMIINHFKMHSNIVSYNLSGMGCSAGIIAIDLARQMLQLHPNSYALVVSTENITQNWYFGNQRSMLIPNCIFRVGCAAMVLSNRRRDAWRAKYELLHTVRTHLGANDQAYNCIFQQEDDKQRQGVKLSKELMGIAGQALKTNITTMGPLVLPFSEQLLFFLNLVVRKGLGRKIKPYIPDFKLAFDHVCIHTGGRAVIDEIEKQLQLTKSMVEPSRATLYRYGNVSSSSIWYVLSYLESTRGIKRGDRVWQLGFGSGFKCNSAVWRAMRRVRDNHYAWDGFDAAKMWTDLEQM